MSIKTKTTFLIAIAIIIYSLAFIFTNNTSSLKITSLSNHNDEIASLIKSFKNMQFNINERTKSLKETNHALLLSENIIMKTSKAICITDMHSPIIKVNESFYKLTGFKQDEIIGQNPRFLKSNRHTADFYKKMKSELNTTRIWSGEIWNKKKNGKIHPIWLTINAIYDKYGIVQNYIGLLSDISNLKQAEEQVTKLAYYDSLTKLPNRFFINKIL